MPGLWADGWFYISSAGLLVSGALFFFLLGQYRAASDAADEAHVDEPIETPATVPVRPVYIPDEPDTKPLPVAAAPAPAAAAAPAPAPAPAPAAEKAEKKDSLSTGSTTTGGISPAVVYLQNLKNQMDEMGVELRGLGKKIAAVSDRDEALIERLAELTRAVEELKAAGAAAAPAPAAEPPAPKRARKAAPAPEPEPAPAVEREPSGQSPMQLSVAPAPAAEPAPAPALATEPAPTPVAEAAAAPAPEPAAPASELKIELGSAPGTGAPVVAGAPNPDATMRVEDLKAALGQQEEKAEDDKPRRGPVWPV